MCHPGVTVGLGVKTLGAPDLGGCCAHWADATARVGGVSQSSVAARWK